MLIKNLNILKILGWEIVGDFNLPNKSVIIFAPHTSYWDGFYGKLLCSQLNLNYKFLSKKQFFKFPLNYVFKLYGSIPVSKNKEYVNEVVSLLNTATHAMVHKLAKENIEKYQPDIIINLPFDIANTFDFHKAEELIELGEKSATKEITKYLNLKNEDNSNNLRVQ